MRLMNYLVLLTTAAITVLSACSSVTKAIGDKDINYKGSRKAAPLDVPPDLTKPSRDSAMTVPDVNTSGTATLSAYSTDRKPNVRQEVQAAVSIDQNKARFERRGDKFWVVVQGSPTQVMQNIREFWLQLGFVLTLDNPAIGILETDWAENRANIPKGRVRAMLGKVLDSAYSSGTLDRYRVRVEAGGEPNTTEIYLTHRGMAEEIVGDNLSPQGTRWKSRKRDEELEVEMLKRLMVHIGVDKNRAKTVIAAKGQPTTTSAASIARPGNDAKGAYLEVNQEFSKSWRLIGIALDRTGFTVEDRDRSKGIYYVRYNDAEANANKKGGMLSKMRFWKKKDEASKDAVYQVYLESVAQATRIRVRDKDGKAETGKLGKQIMALLQENIK